MIDFAGWPIRRRQYSVQRWAIGREKMRLTRVEPDCEDSDLISSKLEFDDDAWKGMPPPLGLRALDYHHLLEHHLPLFDLDFPAKLLPSSTPGHYHLYFDKLVTWKKYKKVMKAMVSAGLLERGWYKAALKEGGTFLRHPQIVKPGFTPKKEVEASVQRVEDTFRAIQTDLANDGIRSFLSGMRALAEHNVRSNLKMEPLDVMSMIDLAFRVAGEKPLKDVYNTGYSTEEVDVPDLVKLFQQIKAIQ